MKSNETYDVKYVKWHVCDFQLLRYASVGVVCNVRLYSGFLFTCTGCTKMKFLLINGRYPYNWFVSFFINHLIHDVNKWYFFLKVLYEKLLGKPHVPNEIRQDIFYCYFVCYYYRKNNAAYIKYPFDEQ